MRRFGHSGPVWRGMASHSVSRIGASAELSASRTGADRPKEDNMRQIRYPDPKPSREYRDKYKADALLMKRCSEAYDR